MANPFSVSFPICVTDEEIGLQLNANAYAKGVFSFRVTDPMAFYQRIFRGANGTMSVQDVLPQLQAEYATALTEASSTLFTGSLRLSDMPGKVGKLSGAVSGCMTDKWVSLRGFKVVSTAIESLTVCDRDMRTIQTIERAKINRDPAMAAATLTTAQADAMTEAAGNENGGFVAVRAVYPPAPDPSPVPNAFQAPTAQPIPNVFHAPAAQPLPSSRRRIFSSRLTTKTSRSCGTARTAAKCARRNSVRNAAQSGRGRKNYSTVNSVHSMWLYCITSSENFMPNFW